MPHKYTFEDFLAAFWAKVNKTDTCWEWRGHKNHPNGYGAVVYQGKMQQAHRVSYALAHGAVPVGLYVCHHCDNKLCIRPDHLFLGTHAENMADGVAKGRFIGNRPPPGRPQRGSSNGNASLSEEDVREIRRQIATGAGQAALARHYGVTRSHISWIKYGRVWGWLDQDHSRIEAKLV